VKTKRQERRERQTRLKRCWEEKSGVDFVAINGAGYYRIVFCAAPGRKVHKRFSPTFAEAKEIYEDLRKMWRSVLPELEVS
jgi:hypothetical protein